MDIFIGIDGIRGGWAAVYIDEEKALRFGYSSEFHRLLEIPHRRAMIDVPIGLPERGYRQCDREARQKVGPGVFLGARWNLWAFPSFRAANAHYWGDKDRGISLQLWNIRDKLEEVNNAMTPAKQPQLLEAHPEVVFWRLNNNTRLADSKKTAAGRHERIELLKPKGFNQIDKWLGELRGTGIGRDDLIDACACALAAREQAHKFPEGASPEDGRGLRMEIWY